MARAGPSESGSARLQTVGTPATAAVERLQTVGKPAAAAMERLQTMSLHLGQSGAAGSAPVAPASAATATATLGFGIVGCGMISAFHQKAIAGLGGEGRARLVGCCDNVAAAAERFGAEHGCKAFGSLSAMLADPAIAVVTICTPSGLHMEPAVAAAEAGKHVIVEKPLEVTLARCDAIIAACAANDVTLGTVFPTRFHDASQRLKAAVDAGRFGQLTMGDAYVKWYRDQEYYDSGAWRGTWKMVSTCMPPPNGSPQPAALPARPRMQCRTAAAR
eukprot:SAG22_NODE_1945_length_3279_cov_1.768239_5_plen_275_part_00